MFRPFSIRPSSGLDQTWRWPYRKRPKHVVCLLTSTNKSIVFDLTTWYHWYSLLEFSRNGMGDMDWTDLAQDRNRWKADVNGAMKLRVPYNARDFLNSWGTVSFSGKTLLQGIRRSVLSVVCPPCWIYSVREKYNPMFSGSGIIIPYKKALNFKVDLIILFLQNLKHNLLSTKI